MTDTNAEIRQQIVIAWRQRYWRGVWFYGTWLFHRYYGGAILFNAAVAIAAVLVIVHTEGRV